ncbi:hypothetical protein GGS23DRAFT_545190 [Durotheca rogersii]|uniref:uncharacterized protein n=1 Tax=Durotheca rogersii TaxID=419775 RepID=UPI00221E7900|nr:uncharacterized protein GGS23DRAFT_545190 [Durotheca rogersii]KAI5868380.1 hypothetical protein GGS23DRAFT_545190 [Durotheca rogersii]
MPPRYDEAPELTPNNLPEVHLPPSISDPEVYDQPVQHVLVQPITPVEHVPAHYLPTPLAQPEESFTNQSTPNPDYATVDNPTTPSPYGYEQQPAHGEIPPAEQVKTSRRIWGCSVLVLILSVIIAILSAAVIGLAAGTGVEASRANDAEARLAEMVASPVTLTVTAPSPSPTGFSAIDKGCSTNSAGVTRTKYRSQFFNTPTFTIYCNSDAPNPPLQSLFVANFDDCIDACASYSFYIPSDFPNATALNTTCVGLSFIPAWTNRDFAFDGNAPGNCYLKPGPQNETALRTPNIGGSAVHAAILDS